MKKWKKYLDYVFSGKIGSEETGEECGSVLIPRLIRQNRTLDFVYANRGGNYQGEQFDMVFGPVANDTIYRTFVAYEEGILTKEEII